MNPTSSTDHNRIAFAILSLIVSVAYVSLAVGETPVSQTAPLKNALQTAPDPALAQDARRVAALSDIATLRDAETVVQLDTLFYTSLENLNDLPGINDLYPRDGIQDMGGAWMLGPFTGQWEPDRKLLDIEPSVWRGPYVNFQSEAGDDGAGYDPGTPLDPWGNPYLLFTPLGLARPTIPDITLEYYGDTFDRWYIVSFANDGIMSEDDIGLDFGGPPYYLVISSLTLLSGTGVTQNQAPSLNFPAPTQSSPSSTAIDSPSAATVSRSAAATLSASSWTVAIKGYNFGASQSTSSVLLDGVDAADPATSWTSTGILQSLPSDLEPGPHTIALQVNSTTSNTFPFMFTGTLAAVESRLWSLYE